MTRAADEEEHGPHSDADRAESLLRGGLSGIALVVAATAGVAACGALIAFVVSLLV